MAHLSALHAVSPFGPQDRLGEGGRRYQQRRSYGDLCGAAPLGGRPTNPQSHRTPPVGEPGALLVTVYSFPSCRYNRSISRRLNGREPLRPNTASWLPLSSTARSRSRPFESAMAGPLVLYVAISSGCGSGLNP